MQVEDRRSTSIDVVMACYREPLHWLTKSIDSILNQTEQDFTFIIVLDDPENTVIAQCLASYQAKDERIKILINEENIGLAASLCKGIQASSSPYIARMDADDISRNDRFSLQLDFLKKHPEIGLVGSAIENIDEKDTVLGIKAFESDSSLLEKMIPFCSVACHPTWMFTRECYERVDGYRNLSTAQDYDFLYRLIDAGVGITNLALPLLKYRIHNSSITSGMSLKRYKIRQYIHDMHNDRVNSGSDTFSEEKLNVYISKAKTSPMISKLLTKLRQAEEKNSPVRALYLVLLTLFSADIRQRVVDHLRLKWLMSRHQSMDN